MGARKVEDGECKGKHPEHNVSRNDLKGLRKRKRRNENRKRREGKG